MTQANLIAYNQIRCHEELEELIALQKACARAM